MLVGGGRARGDVLDCPGAAAVSADGQTAGADGVRDARDQLRRPEESGALPGGRRAALSGAVVLADARGVFQRGACALHALRLRTIPAARQHGRHLPEVSDHEGRPGQCLNPSHIVIFYMLQFKC